MSQVKMLQQVPVEKIKPSPYQPRLTFNLEDIRGSIQRDGILVALTVRQKEDYYELVDGERRLRLAQELGYKTVPCDIIEIDDDTARRLVWKVNTLRQDYTTREKAHYFKKLQEEYRMSLEGIARECDYSRPQVTAYLNIFKLPEKYQKYVWDGQIGVADLHELSPLFNGGAGTYTQIVSWLDQRLSGSLRTSQELREALKPQLTELQEARVAAAQKAVTKMEPEVRLKTPEDYQRAAQALQRKAREMIPPEKKREKLLQRAQSLLDSFQLEKGEEVGINVKPYREKLQEIGGYLKKNPEGAIEELRELKGRFNDRVKEAKLRAEVRREAEQELLKDEKFLRRAVELAPLITEEVPKEETHLTPTPQQLEGIAESLKHAIIESSKEIAKIRGSEERKLMENYVILGTFIQALDDRKIFCYKHKDEQPALQWPCGTMGRCNCSGEP